ncbi:MAG: NADH-quinone oxidoreductase subunit A [Phycisphaeraceae bacterium]|nr:NADH-quinone oxidoreductase subunit A [Phycisphaeraceae bacterium]
MSDYTQLLIYAALGIVFALLALIAPALLSPRYKGGSSQLTYECGIDTIGPTWVRFGVSYYLFALIFVAFEVDILYLFPVALVFDDPQIGWRAFGELAIFLVILSLAILYAWRKGVIKWTN